jgi:hypothetical protein
MQWATPKAEEHQQQNSQDDYASLSKQVKDWPTPGASLGEAGATSRSGDRKGELLLGGQVRNLEVERFAYGATAPQTSGVGGEATPAALHPQIPSQVTNWPTPQCQDEKQKGNRPHSSAVMLIQVVGQHAPASPSTHGKPRGSLNAEWVAQLMGFPPAYTAELTRAACEYWETHGATR